MIANITLLAAQEPRGQPVYRVEVNLVLLTVAVTDHAGHYVTGLGPNDFRVFEDGIEQKVSAFAETGVKQNDLAAGRRLPLLAGSNVFVLFDTSNIMYRGFPYAQDAISDFIRSLEAPDSVAVYGFSRNLLRACPLTADRRAALIGVHQVVAGDDTALYNALLLTIEDAAKVPGRKAVVLFSNGPDNSSMISPDAALDLAENEGIPIYIIGTQDAEKDEVTSAAFRRLTSRTAGKIYFARTWQKQAEAFGSIREDLEHLYALSYYPAPNPNMNWRSITVELTGEGAGKYHVRTRSGYHPKTHSDSQLATR